jgi:hypothetical protein
LKFQLEISHLNSVKVLLAKSSLEDRKRVLIHQNVACQHALGMRVGVEGKKNAGGLEHSLPFVDDS